MLAASLLRDAGLSNVGDRHTQAVVDDPHKLAKIKGETFVVTGYASGNKSGISRVEISTDGGDHGEEVEIFSNPMPGQMWAFWKYLWKNAPKGKQTLKVRATDGRGKVQSSDERGEWPDGATGHYRIEITVI
jgi:hypothetical protein